MFYVLLYVTLVFPDHTHYLCMLFSLSADIFKIIFFEKSFRNTTRVPNDTNKIRPYFLPDLVWFQTQCLQKSPTDSISIIKVEFQPICSYYFNHFPAIYDNCCMLFRLLLLAYIAKTIDPDQTRSSQFLVHRVYFHANSILVFI